MNRTMRDSAIPAAIPRPGLDLVAGYYNGRFTWSPTDWARFRPSVPRVRIDVNGTAPADASVLDVENGDATPQEAVPWVQARRKLFPGTAPTIYCNRSTAVLAEAALHAAGLHPGIEYTLWIATLDGDQKAADALAKGPGVVAVQWKGQAQTGGHYDESIVYDPSWHPAAVPGPAWQQTALMQAQTLATAAGNLVKLLEAHQ